MTNQQILERAITQAIDGGWLPYFSQFDPTMTKENIGFIVQEGVSDVRFHTRISGRIYGASGYSLEIASLIFNQEFAKALWGEYQAVPEANYYLRYKEDDGVAITTKHTFYGQVSPWQYHLQQMVIADDPIKYLREHLDD